MTDESKVPKAWAPTPWDRIDHPFPWWVAPEEDDPDLARIVDATGLDVTENDRGGNWFGRREADMIVAAVNRQALRIGARDKT